MRIAVVTASIGERRRRLYTPQVVQPGVEYLCFTDNPRLTHPVWNCIHRAEVHPDPCRDAKRFKVLVHEHVEADASVWIDAHCRLMCDPTAVWDTFDEPVSVLRHWRRCIYHEARACIRERKDDPDLIRRTMAGYRRRHPPRWGLFYGGVLLRRHTPDAERLNRLWWELIQAGSRRDQLSLPVALRESRVPVHTIERSRRAEFLEILRKR